jgi:hypothetical protein
MSTSSESSFEFEVIDSIDVPQKTTSKRAIVENENYYRPRRQSSREQFYDLLINIVSTLQSSTKNDIRQAKERELQRRSTHIIGN